MGRSGSSTGATRSSATCSTRCAIRAATGRMLGSPEFRARAAATRVLCYWRDRVPNALALLNKLAADPHPRVRLEAVRAASFLTEPEAIEVPLIAAEQPSDQYIDFVRGETMK